MLHKKLSVLSFTFLVLTACTGSQKTTVQPVQDLGKSVISKNDLRANLFFIASPEMEGRNTTERGQKLAARFLATELMRYGILPAGDNGTYYQTFEMDVTGVQMDSSYILIGNKKYAFGTDFLAFPQFTNPYQFANAEAVFVGYGVDNVEAGVKELEGKDLTGKVAVILNGLPKSIPQRQGQGRMGGAFAKIPGLKAKGAIAVLVISAPEADAQLKRFADFVTQPGMTVSNPNAPINLSTAPPMMVPSLSLSSSVSNHLLSEMGLNSEKVYQAMKDGDLISDKSKSIKVSSAFVKFGERKTTENIVGWLEGSDPILKKEFVSAGAHYDHTGKIDDDRIYYGADDDGSGTVAVLEMAKAFSYAFKNGQKTKRSLIFKFYTGEEKGLHGSRIMAEKGLSIMDSVLQIVANINLDMVGREHVDSIDVVGHDRLSSEFEALVESTNKDLGLFTFNYAFNNPNDPADVYKRSDHYNWAKKGIPIVFFTDGMGENWQKGSQNDDYHKITDTPDKINYEKVTKITLLSYELMKRTANLPKRPVVDRVAK